MTTSVPGNRWDALDVLRGLTIIVMLLNLGPGSWEHNFGWLTHAKWEGWPLIDMVAPAFLFCIGVAMPLSFERRYAKGATRGALLNHVITRGLLLVAIGFFLNLYPTFNFETVRIPGVLQRIGLSYLIAGVFMLLTAREAPGVLTLRPKVLAVATVVVLLSYWLLLYAVPAPGYQEPSFGPVDSWPAVIDRAVIGTQHFFQYWPVDGKVVFDPEGIVSTWPSCANVLFGALVGIAYTRGYFRRPALIAVLVGLGLMVLAFALRPLCPIVKNIWTSTFVLLSSGFTLAVLGVLMPISQVNGLRQALVPARIFGENPLLAYIICFLIAPLIDYNWFGTPQSAVSLRAGGQAWFEAFLEPRVASFAFGVCGILLILAILFVCHRRRWILKL